MSEWDSSDLLQQLRESKYLRCKFCKKQDLVPMAKDVQYTDNIVCTNCRKKGRIDNLMGVVIIGGSCKRCGRTCPLHNEDIHCARCQDELAKIDAYKKQQLLETDAYKKQQLLDIENKELEQKLKHINLVQDYRSNPYHIPAGKESFWVRLRKIF